MDLRRLRAYRADPDGVCLNALPTAFVAVNAFSDETPKRVAKRHLAFREKEEQRGRAEEGGRA